MRRPVRTRTAASWVAATSVVALAVAGVTSTGSTASGAEPEEIQGLSAVPDQVTLDNQVSADKAPSSAVAETSPGLLRITSPKKIPVMIKYDYDAVASYRGTVSGFAATSPSVTDRKLTAEGVAESDYLGYVLEQERAITRLVESAVPAVTVTASYRVVYGGVAATVPGNSIRQILRDARGRRSPARRAQPAADRLQPGLHQRHVGLQRAAHDEERRPGHPARQPRHRRVARAPGLRRPGQPAGVRRAGDPLQLR